MFRFAALSLVLLAPAAAAAETPGQDIVVRGDSSRLEIERILAADNLDGDRLSPREIVDTMASIERGRAPEDFWQAYQTHLRAWESYADAVEQAAAQQGESTFESQGEAVATAQTAVRTTFAEVERIARLYRARLPGPPVDLRRIA